MRIVKLGMIGAACALAYNLWRKAAGGAPAAFADGQGSPGNRAQIRDAGPEAMRDRGDRSWSKEDQASDESFPASDPPGNY